MKGGTDAGCLRTAFSGHSDAVTLPAPLQHFATFHAISAKYTALKAPTLGDGISHTLFLYLGIYRQGIDGANTDQPLLKGGGGLPVGEHELPAPPPSPLHTCGRRSAQILFFLGLSFPATGGNLQAPMAYARRHRCASHPLFAFSTPSLANDSSAVWANIALP